MSAPRPMAVNSARDFLRASAPAPCSERSVSAAAVPDGNGSCSMLIMFRFMGTARNTPRSPVPRTRPAIVQKGTLWPVMRR